MDENIKNIIEIKKLYTKDTVNKKELSVTLKVILESVKKFGDDLFRELTKLKEDFNLKVKELNDSRQKDINNFGKKFEAQMVSYFNGKIKEMGKEVEGLISYNVDSLKTLIPKEVDLSDVNKRISYLENKPDDPEITANEAVALVNTDTAPLIKADRIEGLEDRFKKIEEKTSKSTQVQGTTGRDFVYSQDIGSQFDGVTKTFNISGVYMILAVMLDSYPYGALVEGLHYTYTPQTITFTSEIFEATQLASGQKCKIIAIRP